MKKITFFLFSILIYIPAIAQNFPGKRPSLLLDRAVKVKPMDETMLHYKQGYEGFYKDVYLSEPYAENSSRKTSHTALANRVLKVTAVEPYPLPGQLNYKLQLQDTINNETLYYEFSELAEAKGSYYFEVIGGLSYPPDFYCDYVEQQSDEAGMAHTFTASIAEGITLTRIKKGKNQQYIMEVRTVETFISMVKGVNLVMENGLQIHKPDVLADVVASANDNLIYTATFELTQHEASLLSQSKIVSGKISKFDKVYNEGEKLMEMVKCMLKK